MPQSIHVRLEVLEVVGEMLKVKVMYDHEEASSRGNDKLRAVRGELGPHEATRVEDFVKLRHSLRIPEYVIS